MGYNRPMLIFTQFTDAACPFSYMSANGITNLI